tara:strand:- start:512 stop:856 length:345 start_codon:yes stop_codon:yes gene_type:complete
MLMFTFVPVIVFVAVLVLGEAFDVSFLLPKYSHEGALFWTLEDMFPPKDYRWEEMLREAVEATTPPAPLEVESIRARETIPQGSYGGNSYPTDKEYWEDVEALDELLDLVEGTF